ncbi:MAG: rhomboid family intramembrane serine protease [Bacteroidales bacterium]
MFERFGGRGGSMPPAVLNLLIINVIFYLATYVLANSGIDLVKYLGLYYPGSELFRPHQLITHMFMHATLTHLFFNMFALWMFGRVLESVWGSRRFLVYYFATGLGAAALHLLVNSLAIDSMANEAQALINTLSPDTFAEFLKHRFPEYQGQVSEFVSNWSLDPNNPMYLGQAPEYIRQLMHLRMDIPTIGASGAVFGILLAFGMLFPNTQLMLLFPPIPIKAKWFVLGYGVIEFVSAIWNQPGDNVAHFAHLGGMIFGFILIKFWNRTKRQQFY